MIGINLIVLVVMERELNEREREKEDGKKRNICAFGSPHLISLKTFFSG